MSKLRLNRGWIETTAGLYRQHRFDLLGSGWVRVEYGMRCAGLDGTRISPETAVSPDPDGLWLRDRINRANFDYSRSIWRLVDATYVPIDWHLDFKSGYRWNSATWSKDIRFGIVPNVDVKVPWELARMQHLATLAWAHALSRDDGRNDVADAWWREYRNQVLDFIATNPPRYGVNWVCTMDVAIRGANLAMSYALFCAGGARPDVAFDMALGRSLRDHAVHVSTHLEWHPEGRGNHYLANIAGLAFIAATLPRSSETDTWIAFAAEELDAEIEHQFNDDGSHFEGSTSYHRLCAEMVVFATALLVGYGEELAGIRASADTSLLRRRRTSCASAGATIGGFDPAHFDRIAAMAAFTAGIVKPGGHVPQIGDNDSGRFFRLHPKFVMRVRAEAVRLYSNLPESRREDDRDPFPDEDLLDHGGLLAAAAILVGSSRRATEVAGWLDEDVIAALLRTNRSGAPDAHRRNRPVSTVQKSQAWDRAENAFRTVRLELPGGSLRADLQLASWPDFGLWVFRSPRLYLAVRCGRGTKYITNHAHNDQLSFELSVDDVDWIIDPGSYLYAPPRARRDSWRSVKAHPAPALDGLEPAPLTVGNFCLPARGIGRCLRFDENGFVGEYGDFGRTVRREFELGSNTLTIADFDSKSRKMHDTLVCRDRDSARSAFLISVPFSPGYGRLLRQL